LKTIWDSIDCLFNFIKILWIFFQKSIAFEVLLETTLSALRLTVISTSKIHFSGLTRWTFRLQSWKILLFL